MPEFPGLVQGFHEVFIVLGDVAHVDQMGQFFQGISLSLGDQGFHPLAGFGDHILDHSLQQVFLGTEIIINSPFGNSYCIDHILHGGFVIFFAPEQFPGGFNDFQPAFLGGL